MTLGEIKKRYFGKDAEVAKQKAHEVDSDTIFDAWSNEKKTLHVRENYPRPKKREVWMCVIGKNIGQEQSCKGGYVRPILVLQVFGGLFWGIPITSSDPNGTKEKNPVYYKLDGMSYENEHGAEKELHGFLAFHQLRVLDSRRLKRKILRLDKKLFNTLRTKAKGMI